MDRRLIFFLLMVFGIIPLKACYRKPYGRATSIPKVFDYIIVGAGAAGATIASRLSENPDITVLLLEAGMSDTGHYDSTRIETPRLWRTLVPSRITRNYTTLPQDGLNKRILATGMGKTLGGSTSHNAMSYWRGFKSDFDYWSDNGAKGWSYREVFPFYLKSENNISPLLSNSAFHNKSGPLTISNNLEFIKSPLYDIFRATADEMEIPFVDCTEPEPFGLCLIQSAIKDGKRQSTSVAYLRPVMERENLFVLTQSVVEKILIRRSEKRAYGVRYSNNGTLKRARARREVIVSAGSIDTPKLLQLSGIGPRSLLRNAKIPSLVNLPVGCNYQDHLLFAYNLFMDIPTVTQEMLRDPETLSEYHLNRTGLYAGTPESLNIFYETRREKRYKRPEVQVLFTDGNGNEGDTNGISWKKTNEVKRNGTMGLIFLLHPESTGTVKIKSRDPQDPPLINPQFFQEQIDVEKFIEGIRKLQELTRSSSMRQVHAQGAPEGTIPDECLRLGTDSDEQLECILRNQVSVGYHPAGSCKMGDRNDSTTVVDPELKVKGIRGLRVADASIMPEITSTNTMGPVIMIGEKAADMILKEYKHTDITGNLPENACKEKHYLCQLNVFSFLQQ